ncbi:helix-turn-helix domain-containing protein [Streptacidiphilus griseoplanus]|uniref:helix-turn-helix domain-containing protein n=1 Tax=Peterkaempfera griseoplana TaxID=66896 RepID=UPI0006E1B9C6|nr:helix-turn-helix domain-containing protein [Peterkaempfera griseoplana]
MIRVEFDEASLGRTRIAVSPLWDAYVSVCLAQPDRQPSWPYRRWVGRAREVLQDDERTRPLRALLGRYDFPDFTVPRPLGSTSIEEDLRQVRQTPPDRVREQVVRHFGSEPPAEWQPYLTDPEASCNALADAFQAYWDGALAAHWPVMRRLVEDEVLARARVLATAGIDALFTGLEPRASWQPPVLTMTKYVDFACAPGERSLLLVPLVFAEGARLASTDDPAVFTLSFQARGAAALRDDTEAPAAPTDRLGLLLGRGRAAVLRELEEDPLTTAGVADRLGLAPSTVSEHLAMLAEAGVVTRHRVGRRVYYRTTETGRALLSLLAGEGVLRTA